MDRVRVRVRVRVNFKVRVRIRVVFRDCFVPKDLTPYYLYRWVRQRRQ